MEKILVFILSLQFVFLSCNKFLDKKPLDAIAPDNYYKTSQELSRALTGVYDILGRAELYGSSIPIDFSMGTDEAYSNINGASGILVNQFDPSNPVINNIWNSLYTGIDRANLLLEKLDASNADSATKSVTRGEALFLRAYYHFVLVSFFGDVPLKLTSTQSVINVSLPRTPSTVIYDQITKDMIEAEGRVRTATEVKTGGRISKSAVRGILARVYLYWSGYPLNAKKYDEVLKWAQMVNQNVEHSLNPDYRSIFINYAQDKYDIKESIWEVEFYFPGANTYTEGSRLGNINGVQCSNLDTGYSYGQMNGTAKLFNSYGGTLTYCLDNRRDWVMANYKLGGTNPIRTQITGGNLYDRNSAKWRREYEPYAAKDKNFTNQNFPLLRYSDVLLMIAEADNELNGPQSLGINAINSVRQRSYKSIASATIINGGSGYISAPNVVITGNGTGATATATISAGKVSAINIIYPGYGYQSQPAITIIGGGGTGATASAVLAKSTDADVTTSDIADKDAFRTAIQNERLRELCSEGYRRFDLIRWGNYVQYMNNYAFDTQNASVLAAIAGKNVSIRNVLLPIPATELSVNKSATQNPGY